MNERLIFEKAVEIRDPAERTAYLDHACGGDPTLRKRVEDLLASHDQASGFLTTPVVEQIMPKVVDAVPTVVVRENGNPAPSSDNEDDANDGTDLSFLQPSEKSGSVGRLGHYEILQVLGKGAFGIVFKAFDEKLHRCVAVKSMSPQLAATSPPRKRFLREARSVAAIKHENIVQIYSVEEQPIPYLAMEFVDGQTLQQKLDAAGPLEAPEILHLGRQMAAGLAAAHEKGLIHRDIKPGNILLESGAEQKVKITDFGLARAADDATMTRTGTIAGTPMYMAPEQAMGQDLDHRADLFSLGSVLYQMTCGRAPFRGSSAIAVLKRVVDETPRPIRQILPEAPGWLCTIIEKLHAKNPDERYQTAKEVADLMARCQNELQVHGVVTCVQSHDGFVRRSSSDATNVAPRGSMQNGDQRSVAVTLSGEARKTSRNTMTYLRPLLVAILLMTTTVLAFWVVRKSEPDQASRNTQVVEPATETSRAEPNASNSEPLPEHKGETDFAAEQQAAEWVCSIGGYFLVRFAGGDSGFIYRVQDLPKEPFQMLHIELLQNQQVSDEGLENLTGLKELQSLNIHDTPVTDAGIAHLRNLKSLTTLRMGCKGVTDVGLGYLKDLTNLTELGLQNTQITDAGLANLRGMSKLQILTFANCSRIGDAGLKHLEGLTELRDLNLVGAQRVTDAGMVYLKGMKELTILPLHDTQVGDGALEHIKGLPKLQVLDLPGRPISDLGLAHLKNMTELTSLNLDKSRITDAGLQHLQGLSKLTHLNIAWTSIDGTGLVNLKNPQSFKYLQLSGTQVDDAALKHLQGFTNLETLHLSETKVTGEGLANLSELHKLALLDLGRTPMTDAGMEPLSAMTSLQTLLLHETGIGDQGLQHLSGLTNLRVLGLRNTKVTDAGLSQLHDIKTLTTLDLDGTAVGNSGLTHLLELPNLASLFLNFTHVNEGALEHLVKMNGLSVLELRHTRITNKGFATLKQVFPNSQIQWSEVNQVAATEILNLGGKIQIRTHTSPENQTITAIADLPAEDYQLVRVQLDQGQRTDFILPEFWPLLLALSDPQFDHLESIDLTGPILGDESVKDLRLLPNLIELSFVKNPITDVGLVHLRHIPGLQRLVLDGCPINGTGLASATNDTEPATTFHTLTELSLANTRTTDESMVCLREATRLRRLILNGSPIRGDGLTHLKELPELTELGLACPRFTDLFANQLAELKHLEKLSLAGSGITDQGLSSLHQLSHLTELDLTGCQVTPAGIESLKAALPDCKCVVGESE